MAGGDENNKPSFSYIGQRTVQPFQPRYGYFPCGINDDTATACAKIQRWLEILSSKNKDSVNNILNFIDCIAEKYTGDKAGTICNLAGESENIIETDFLKIPEFVNPVLDACQDISNAFNSLDSIVPAFSLLSTPDKIGDILPTDENGNYYFPIPTGINTGACIAEYFFERNDGVINNINSTLFDIVTDEEYTPTPPDTSYNASPGELALGQDYPDIYKECFGGDIPIFTQCEVRAIWNTFTSVDGSGARSLDLNADVDKKYKECRKNLKRLNKIFNNDIADALYGGYSALQSFWCDNFDITGKRNFEQVIGLKDKLASINTQITDWTNVTNDWANWITAPATLINCTPVIDENFVGSIFENYIEPTIGILPPGVDIQIDPLEGIVIDIDPNQTLSEILGPVGSLFLPPDLPTLDLDLNYLLNNEDDFCQDLKNLKDSMRDAFPENNNIFDVIDELQECLENTPEGTYYLYDENDNLIRNPNFTDIIEQCLRKGLTVGQKIGLGLHFGAGFLNQYWTNTGYRINQLWNFANQIEPEYISEQVGDICSRVIKASQMIGENGEWKSLTDEELCLSRSAVLTIVSVNELSQLLERRNLIDEYCLSSRNNVAEFLGYTNNCLPETFCTATPTLGQSISDFVSQFKNKDCIALSSGYFIRVNNINTQSQRLIFGPPNQYKIPAEYCNLCTSDEDPPALDDDAKVPSNPIIDEEFIITFPPYPMPGFGDGAFDPPNLTPPPPSFVTCASFTVPYDMPMYTVAQYFRDDNGIAPSVSQIKEVNPELALVSIVTAGTVVKAPSPYCNRVLSTQNGACYIIVNGVSTPVNCPGEDQFNLDPERPVLLLPPSNDGVNLPFNINITE